MLRSVGLLASAVFTAVLGGVALAADLPDAWTELGADGALSVRAIVPAGAPCPMVDAAGSGQAVASRGEPDSAFPISVCTARVAAGTGPIRVAGQRAPALPDDLRRVVVIGDTGCRIKNLFAQDCNDPAAWRFAAIARAAALQRPDLVIHVGDYHYRESPCPDGKLGCAGSPWGDNWAAWKADFFDPAAPLLAAAPWVMVRGNHEICGRAGNGWFRLLDPRAVPAECLKMTEPYALHLPPLELRVLDSADADDDRAPPDKVALYRGQLAGLLADAPPHAWLLTHRPVWALAEGWKVRPDTTLNATEQAAIAGLVPDGLEMVVSGHVHDFTIYDFGVSRPAQLVVGDSGDSSDEFVNKRLPGIVVDGLPILAAFGDRDYGFLVLDRDGAGWRGTVRGADDRVLARCGFAGRSPSCEAVD